MNPFVKLGISTILIACSAIAVWGTYFPLQAAKLLGRSARSDTDNLSLTSSIQLPTAGPFLFREAMLDIKFPTSMIENETKLLEMSYAVSIHTVYSGPLFDKNDAYDFLRLDPSLSNQTLKRLDEKVQFELKSSGFSIEPSEVIEKDKDSSLPIREAWTITPVGSGDRVLLLRLHEVEDKDKSSKFGYPTIKATTLNGKRTVEADKGYYPIPIKVDTFWGVSSRTVAIISGAIALIAFILSWSVIEDWLKRKLHI